MGFEKHLILSLVYVIFLSDRFYRNFDLMLIEMNNRQIAINANYILNVLSDKPYV